MFQYIANNKALVILILIVFINEVSTLNYIVLAGIQIYLLDIISLAFFIYYLHYKISTSEPKSIISFILMCYLVLGVVFLQIKLNISDYSLDVLLFVIYFIIKSRKQPIDMEEIIVLFFIYCTLNLFLGLSKYDLEQSGKYFRDDFYFFSIALFLATQSSILKNNSLLKTLLAFAFVSIVLFFLRLQNIIPWNYWGDLDRFMDSNLASIIACAFLGSLYVYFKKGNKYVLLLSMCFFIIIIMAKHRSVWLASFASGIILIIVSLKEKYLLSFVTLSIPVIACIICTVLFIGLPRDSTIKRAWEDAFSYKEGNTASWRVEGWQILIEKRIKTSIIRGEGSGTSPRREMKSGIIVTASAHNYFVDTFYTHGLIGLLFCVSLLFLILKKLRFIEKSEKQNASLLFILILFFIFYFISYGSTIFYSVVIGYALNLINAQKNSNELPIS